MCDLICRPHIVFTFFVSILIYLGTIFFNFIYENLKRGSADILSSASPFSGRMELERQKSRRMRWAWHVTLVGEKIIVIVYVF